MSDIGEPEGKKYFQEVVKIFLNLVGKIFPSDQLCVELN